MVRNKNARRHRIDINKKPALDDALTVRTSAGVREQLEVIAGDNGVTVAQVIRYAIDEWLEGKNESV